MKIIFIITIFLISCLLLTYKNKIDHPPKSHKIGDPIPILTNNRLYSKYTLILQDYELLYQSVCNNDDITKVVPERCNVDRILTNNEWSISTIYNITYLNDVNCRVINNKNFTDCQETSIDNIQLELLKILIENQYQYQLRIDEGLPINNPYRQSYYQHGLKIGSILKFKNNDNLAIKVNNHLNINVLYDVDTNTVIGFHALAESRKYESISESGECKLNSNKDVTTTLVLSPDIFDPLTQHPLVWSYSVTFKPYQTPPPQQPFLISTNTNLVIIFSIITLAFLSYSIINNNILSETPNSKLITKVPNTFISSPAYLTLHSILIGYGAQLWTIIGVLLFATHMTWLSFNSIITIKSGTFSLIQLSSFVAGYTSTKNFLFFNRNPKSSWLKTCVITTITLPIILYSLLLGNNWILNEYRSPSVMSTPSIVKTLLFYFGFYLPVGILGGYYASRNQYPTLKNIKITSDTNNIKIFSTIISKFSYILRPYLLIPLVSLSVYWLPNELQSLFVDGDDLGYHSEFRNITVQLITIILVTIALTIIQVYFSVIHKYFNIWWLPFLTSYMLTLYQSGFTIQNAAYYSGYSGTMTIYYSKCILFSMFSSISIGYISFETTKWFVYNLLQKNSK